MAQRKLRIYLCAPLFNYGEKAMNVHNAKLLRSHGWRCFLPQELGMISDDAEEDLKEKCFEDDLKAIELCDVMISNANGPDIDSGSAAEIGQGCLLWMQKQKGIDNGSKILCKPLVFKGDVRNYYAPATKISEEKRQYKVNNYILGNCYDCRVFTDVEEMIPILEELQKQITEEEGSIKYGLHQYDFEGEIQPTKEVEEIVQATTIDQADIN